MILVCEEDPEHPSRIITRVVLDKGEKKPTSLLELRIRLRQALTDLPNNISQVLIIEDRRRPK